MIEIEKHIRFFRKICPDYVDFCDALEVNAIYLYRDLILLGMMNDGD